MQFFKSVVSSNEEGLFGDSQQLALRAPITSPFILRLSTSSFCNLVRLCIRTRHPQSFENISILFTLNRVCVIYWLPVSQSAGKIIPSGLGPRESLVANAVLQIRLPNGPPVENTSGSKLPLYER